MKLVLTFLCLLVAAHSNPSNKKNVYYQNKKKGKKEKNLEAELSAKTGVSCSSFFFGRNSDIDFLIT